AVWGALQTVHTQPVFAPVLRYVGTAPYVLFLKTIGSGQDQLFVTHRSGSAFTIPAPALSQSAPFASVLCHDIDAPTPFADLTAEAADTPGADVRHPQSGALLAAVGDAVYCGGDDRFAFVRMLLSTPGSGGTVAWSYWNGSEWSIFVPDSGDYQCDQADAGVRLFPDGVNTPADWQRSVIAGHNRYWIRVSVTTAFNTLPIGSQLTPIPTSSGATSCC
ncbi:MAG TPA: hypothetical protein VLB27_03850, partial [candidate division Zixibacteria bacterium]|nr:hypothetical protein [candidate division Zixibacteria bacterium]